MFANRRPVIVPLSFPQGEDKQWIVTVRDVGTNGAPGDPIDITGAAVWLTVKRYLTDTVPELELAIGTGITLLAQAGATLGQASILLEGDLTVAIEPGALWYDVWVMDALGNEQPVIDPSPLVLTRGVHVPEAPP